MTDQVDTKQVQWQNLEVAPKQAHVNIKVLMFRNIDEAAFAEAMERVMRQQEKYERLAFLYGNPVVSNADCDDGSALSDSIRHLQGLATLEGQSRAALEKQMELNQVAGFMPVERFGQYTRMPMALCTPDRDPLTGHGME